MYIWISYHEISKLVKSLCMFLSFHKFNRLLFPLNFCWYIIRASKQFGSPRRPLVWWGLIWVQLVCNGHQRSSKFNTSRSLNMHLTWVILKNFKISLLLALWNQKLFVNAFDSSSEEEHTVNSACSDTQGTLKIVSLHPDIITNELSWIYRSRQGLWICIITSSILLHQISLQAKFTVLLILNI